MTIQEIKIGDKVKDRNGFEFEVVALFKDGTVYCDFEGNEGDVWEFKVDELERVVNDVVGQAEDLLDKIAQDEGFGNWETVVLNCHHSVIRSVAIAAVNQALRQLPVGRSRRYWMIISKVEPLTKDAQLPIYWLKRIAEQDAETFGGTVVPVKITW